MTPGSGQLPRRSLLAGAAGVAGLALLEACGGHRVAATPTPTGTASPTPTATPPGLDSLKATLGGALHTPADAEFGAVSELFNRRFDGIRPMAVASVTTAAQVAACVAYARTARAPLAIRSGGHSYLGASTGTGLVVDLRGLASVQVGSGTSTVGAGAALVDVYAQLAAAGVSVPAGSCPTVGLAGIALAGGMGVVARKYGLTCDAVVGAQVVTADGRVRTVDASHDPDLFWALRGGGGSFAVVTALTLRTHPISDLATFTYDFGWSSAAAVTDAWQRHLPGGPDGLWSTLHLLTAPGTGSPTCSVSGVYVGPVGDLTSLLAPFLAAAGTPTGTFVRQRGYLDTMLLEAGCAGTTVAACHIQGQRAGGTLDRDAFVAASDLFTQPLPAAGIAGLLAAVEGRQQVAGHGSGGVSFDTWGGAVNRIAPSSTAFVHRDSLFGAQYTASWQDTPGNGPQVTEQAWLDRIHAAGHSYANGEAYQGYADPQLAAPQTAYYGANLARLRQVKAAYDPTGLFAQPQGISL